MIIQILYINIVILYFSEKNAYVLLYQSGYNKNNDVFFFMTSYCLSLGFPSGSDGKEAACNVRDQSSISGSGRFPGEGNGNPTSVFLPGEFHGQRSLVSYSPWSHKELDTTERHSYTHTYIHTHTHTHTGYS